MTLLTDSQDAGDLETVGDEAERRTGERLRDEVRRLEQAEQFAAALQAIRDARCAGAELASMQPDIARLKLAARLQASYQRATAALEAGDGEAARLLAAVVAVDPRYKDAARLLYETVSGGRVGDLQAEAAASREALSQNEAARHRLARGRVRLAWVAGALGALGVVLCALLGWMAWRRPPSSRPAAGREVLASAAAPSLAPDALTTTGQTPTPPAELLAEQAAPSPLPQASPRDANRPVSVPGSTASALGASADDPPSLDLDGPCRRIGQSCWSSTQCCFGSLCYGTECQDTRRTIVFGQYRR